MVGALSISGMPFLNGFVSKTMISGAIGDAHLEWPILLLLLATIGTFLHTGLKLPYFTWFSEKKSEFEVSSIPTNMKVAMGMGALFCILFGVAPQLLYSQLPYPTDFQPFSVYNFVEMTQILVLAFVGFWFLKKHLNLSSTISLDTDWFYRRPAAIVRTVFVETPNNLFGVAENGALKLANKLSALSNNPMKVILPSFAMEGREVKSDGFTASMSAALAFILFGFLVAILVVLL
jgi:multicomponent Na+:H+ antiporter subunit D